MRITYFRYILMVTILCLSGSCVFAQNKSENRNRTREFCTNNNWSNNNRVSANDLRETTVAARNLVTVDGNRNGGIRVTGSNRSDILVRSCIQAWSTSDEAARTLARSVRIDTGS